MTTTNIEWTDKTWLTAAKRVGVTVSEYRAHVEAGEKYCWRCRSWRPRTSFGVDRSRGDGLAARCTSCVKTPKQLRLIRPTPAERDRLRYRCDPAYRAERRAHAHARSRGLDPLPPDAAADLLGWADGLCLYCDAPATTWDHIVPVSKGGRTEPGNMAPACVSCNSKKKALDVDDFIERYGVVITRRLEDFISLALEGPL